MPIEIERVFLVTNDTWKQQAETGIHYQQSYFTTDEQSSVRVRTAGTKGFITIKGKPNGFSRVEYEYEIPLEEAQAMMNLCPLPPVEKYRHKLPDGDLTWEIDVFIGANADLVMAEIELPTEDTPFSHHSWLGEEVSLDSAYCNARLYKKPFSTWNNK